MSPTTRTTDETAQGLPGADPFELPKRLKRRVKQSMSQTGNGTADSAVYLWIHAKNIGGGRAHSDSAEASSPTLDQWLNVLDEAAALGVRELVVTLDTSLTACPDVWTICQWAQDSYGLMVGLHPNSAPPAPEEMAAVRQLDLGKTRLFVKKAHLADMACAEKEGIKVGACNPQPYEGCPCCQGPAKMIFVDHRGVLYTCGLVEGNQEYHLGTIFQDTFHNILHDPNSPHQIAESLHHISEGCDGCPALIANFPEFG